MQSGSLDNKPIYCGISGERRKLIVSVNNEDVDVLFVTLFQIVQGMLRAYMTLVGGNATCWCS